jgi:hypothetical protein
MDENDRDDGILVFSNIPNLERSRLYRTRVLQSHWYYSEFKDL